MEPTFSLYSCEIDLNVRYVGTLSTDLRPANLGIALDYRPNPGDFKLSLDERRFDDARRPPVVTNQGSAAAFSALGTGRGCRR